MSSRRWKIVGIVAAVVVLVAVAAGVIVWLTTDNSSKATKLNHVDYALLYANAIVHTSKTASTLDQWPKPNEKFLDGNHPGGTCYEWIDMPVAIYSLCFKNDVLIDKAIG